ncbi:17053_t:CDS:2 [Cetraspora pellucida]|uniref:17053_t:CDS:1 n=1 Tax=Cetraspora pellucida TaxID=1433469 RepID=A0A9N9E2N9_9GLOM|nr:17053_t:CDS:2 [Cetraspora pellucida]
MASVLQINVPNRELNLMAYPDFAGGDQVTMIWLDEFQMLTLEEKWFAQLATKKQQINKDFDTYYTAIQELFPEIVLAITSSTPNTLQATYERAKAYKSACKQSFPHFPVSINALYSSQIPLNTALGFPTSITTSESAIKKLTKVVNKMLIQLQNRNCCTSISINSSSPNPNSTGPLKPYTLLTLAASLNPSNNQYDQHTYVSITVEDVPLFAIKSHKICQSKHKRQEEVDLELVAEEPLEQLLEREKEKQAERKVPEDEMLQIASLVPLYSIITDLQNKPANITIGQLLCAVPSMRTELIKSLHKKKASTKRKAKVNINICPQKKSIILYCDAQILGETIPLIVDSGSLDSVVSSYLL